MEKGKFKRSDYEVITLRKEGDFEGLFVPKEVSGFGRCIWDGNIYEGQMVNKNKEGYHGFLHLLYNDLKNYINPSRYHYIDEEKSEIAHSKKYTLSRRLKRLLSKKVLI